MGLFGRRTATIIEDEPVIEIQPLDLDRTKYRLDGIGHYGSIAALFMNAALVVLSALPKKFDENVQDNTPKLIGAILSAATIIFGTYTAMVFSLLSLYSKTFLGMARDDEFLEFFDHTSTIRDSAFMTFVGAVLCFNGSFIMTLYLHTEGQVRSWLTTGAMLMFAYCAQQWFTIMNLAYPYLNHPHY